MKHSPWGNGRIRPIYKMPWNSRSNITSATTAKSVIYFSRYDIRCTPWSMVDVQDIIRCALHPHQRSAALPRQASTPVCVLQPSTASPLPRNSCHHNARQPPHRFQRCSHRGMLCAQNTNNLDTIPASGIWYLVSRIAPEPLHSTTSPASPASSNGKAETGARHDRCCYARRAIICIRGGHQSVNTKIAGRNRTYLR